MKKLLTLIIILIVLSLGIYLFYSAGTLPVDKTTKESKIFVIQKGEGLNSITKKLEKEGLIRNKIVFYAVVKIMGIDKNMQAGDFRLSPAMDVYQIAKALTHGTLDTWVTIIEGLRKEEIAQIISQSIGIPEVEFVKVAKEGHLFPDTYLMPNDATAGAVLDILVSNFNRRFNDDLRMKARKLDLTDEEVIILASMVEKEAKFDEDRQKAASVMLRRLRSDMPLQIDATVQYALGYQGLEKTWWKKDLSLDDLKVNSPYNTYKNVGLPPGPIANPGLASIQAVLNADENIPYLYYVSDSRGHLHFARTIEEHAENQRRYLTK